MARRNSDGGPSRQTQGGIRATRVAADISRAIARNVSPLDRVGGSFIRPDLSAFNAVAEIGQPTLYQQPPWTAEPSKAGGTVRKNRLNEPSKRSLERASETRPRLAAMQVIPAAPINRPIKKDPIKLASPVKTKAKLASPTVSHGVRPARLGKAQATCKERPSDNKKQGRGSGKAFVPWCNRKR